jgi:hypothetical protein
MVWRASTFKEYELKFIRLNTQYQMHNFFSIKIMNKVIKLSIKKLKLFMIQFNIFALHN